MHYKTIRLVSAVMLAGMAAACSIAPVEARPGRTTNQVALTMLPVGHQTFLVGKRRYFAHNGIYYRATGNGYRVVAAPAGAIVATLPAGFTTINIRSGRYYRHGNTFYRAAKRGFVVVARPRGLKVVVG